MKLVSAMLVDWWRGDYETPWLTLVALSVALLYVVNPFDIFPDYIPFLGWIDDATVVIICFKLLQRDLRRYVKVKELEPKEHGF